MDRDDALGMEKTTTADYDNDVEQKNRHSFTPADCQATLSDLSEEKVNSAPIQNADPTRRWKPSLWRFGPISGIFAMFFALASLFASLGILAGSDQTPVDRWSAPPSTYLAAFTAIANLSIRYAAIQGTLITWWTGALNGSSLSKLHYDWRASTSLHGAVIAGRRMGLIGLACIASFLVMLDGPLLQRASTAVSGPNQGSPFQVRVQMASQLPLGYTGGWIWNWKYGYPGISWSQSWNSSIPIPGGSVPNGIMLYAHGDSPLQEELDKTWRETKSLRGVVKGCSGQCKLKITTPALFDTKCATKQVAMNYNGNFDVEKLQTYKMAPALSSYGFMISNALDVQGDNEHMVLVTGSSTTQPGALSRADCNSTFTYKTCILQPGLAEYEVQVEDDEIRMDTIGDPKFVAHIDYPVDKANNSRGTHASTLAGVVDNMWSKWESSIAYLKEPGTGPSSFETNSAIVDAFQRMDDSNCTTYRNARDEVMADLNRLMFYVGAFAARSVVEGTATISPGKDSQVQRMVNAQPSGRTSTYHTEYSWFVAASILELVCILFIAPTYWGWWRIGRPVSFSPLEIAKAFESPLFADCNSNSSGRELAKAMEGVNVRYGDIPADESHKTSKLSFGDRSHNVTQPHVGQAFAV